MVNVDSAARQKKAVQIQKIYELLGKYSQIMVVTLENVGSLQSQQIRREIFNKGGVLVIGKNTVIKKAVNMRLRELTEEDEDYEIVKDCKGGVSKIPELESLLPLIKLKVGFIFTDVPVFEMKNVVESYKVAAPARVGMVSPIDVVIPPGPTGMDPSQISFFHALQISTKIQKGQIEITKDYQVCSVGKKIGNSEVTLLQKMNLKPMSYQMNVTCCYDAGDVLGKDVVSMSPNAIIEKFQVGVKHLAAISLETGYQTEASVPYAITNAFKNLAAIGMEVDYKFKQLANAASAQSSAPAATGGATTAEAAKVEEEPEEPEEDMDMGGLFD